MSLTREASSVVPAGLDQDEDASVTTSSAQCSTCPMANILAEI
jgi:hypothetical protein